VISCSSVGIYTNCYTLTVTFTFNHESSLQCKILVSEAIKIACFDRQTFTSTTLPVLTELVTIVALQILDNHVVRYIPPEEYRNYPRYKWTRWEDKFAGVVVGALSMHPFQVKRIARWTNGRSVMIHFVISSWN